MKTLLIVEDEKLIRQGIKNMIQRSGVPVEVMIECNNGEAAWEILEKQKVDVMFTDIRMPKMDGIELVKKVNTLAYQPLTIVISGYDDFSYAVEMLRMGVKEYILKPVDRNQINEIMKRMEQEVQKRTQAELTQKTMSLQLLRFLCLNKKMEDKEKALLENQFKEQFAAQEYEVCCCNYALEGEEQTGTCIYLGTVEQCQVFIVECCNKGLLLQNELSHCYVGFSEPVQGIENLQTAYKQALAMRKQAFAAGLHVVDYQRETQSTQQEDADFLQETGVLSESQYKEIDTIVTMLGTNHIEEIQRRMTDLIEQVQAQQVSMQVFEQWIHIFLSRTAKNYEKVLKVETEDLLELDDMYQYQTLEEYKQTLLFWIGKFHDLISEEFDDCKNKKKMQQALVYMQENFHKDLNMAVVSNHISMNYSLFSYTFKQYTGKNFVTYLKELRMEKAKQLLRETDLRVVEISQQVGFENEKHFMKTFKILCGVSPTEYRKTVSKQDNFLTL